MGAGHSSNSIRKRTWSNGKASCPFMTTCLTAGRKGIGLGLDAVWWTCRSACIFLVLWSIHFTLYGFRLCIIVFSWIKDCLLGIFLVGRSVRDWMTGSFRSITCRAVKEFEITFSGNDIFRLVVMMFAEIPPIRLTIFDSPRKIVSFMFGFVPNGKRIQRP